MDVNATSGAPIHAKGLGGIARRNGLPAMAALSMAAGAALLTITGHQAWLGIAAMLASAFGCVIAGLGAVAVLAFARRRHPAPAVWPPVSVLRPLCGGEPGLDAALASLGAQGYPLFQIVFGVQDAADPALAAVARLQAANPALDITVVTDTTSHGPNRKVSNLINMLPLARYDTLVFSDSDLHVAPDYLSRLVAALAEPGTGLVTALCTGLPTRHGPAARLGAMQITQSFLPGALLSRVLGRQDCLGTTMALKRDTLARAGGLPGLAGHLADDNLLGQHVLALGRRIGLADTVPATGVPERSVRLLWQHELRWARTIRALAPAPFAASSLQFPIAWALLACLCLPAAPALAGLGAAWAVRAAAAVAIGRALAGHTVAARLGWLAALLLPVRDVLSVAEIVASFAGGQVLWRGHVMRADAARALPRRAMPDRVVPIVLEVGD